MSGPPDQRGQKEIRFTRNAQAVHFFMLALLFLCLGVTLYLVSLDVWTVSQEPLLQGSWYGLLTLPFIAGFTAAGIHLAKHAYMIFSPVGIELFPFFFPSKNMEVLYWSEVQDVGFTPDEKMLEITMTGEPERKVFIATAPLNRASRDLLGRTIAGVQEQRAKGTAMLDGEQGSVKEDPVSS